MYKNILSKLYLSQEVGKGINYRYLICIPSVALTNFYKEVIETIRTQFAYVQALGIWNR